MSGQPIKVQSQFIPPPLDGLNLIASPTEFLPTEARTLDNFLIFDQGIRQVPIPTLISNGSGGSIDFQFPYLDSSGVAKVMFSLGNSIFRYNIAAGTTTAITGGSAITNSQWYPVYYNKYIYLFNGTDIPRLYDLSAATVVDTSFTGVTQSTLIQATAYKKRLYIVEKNSTRFWYPPALVYTGALSDFDVGEVLDHPGNLLCVFNWTYNQGQVNDEMFVALTDQGEFLIYSGDYPDAANWQLVAKGRMPAVVSSIARLPFAKVANDVYLVTTRGAVSLSSLVSGNAQPNSYFNLSRKIKLAVVSTVTPVLDNFNPFCYFVGADGSQMTSIYCLNYERQAWSRIYFPSGLAAGTIKSISSFNGVLYIGTSEGDLYSLDVASQTNSSTTHTWETPFFNFGTNLQKNSKMIRLLGLNYAAASTFANTVSASTDFVVPASPTTDTRSVSVAADTNVVQELAPPGTGRWLSYKFSKAGISSTNHKNELQGFEVFFETGGAY